MDEGLTVVGSRMPMLDAAAKVKGAAHFADDLLLPGMLHRKILRSPLPHTKIPSIDFKELPVTPEKILLELDEKNKIADQNWHLDSAGIIAF